MYTFGVCSLWHLAAVSVVKCTVIVRPLTHYTIFTDRVLRAIICSVWILSLLVIVAINAGGVEVQFSWITVVAHVERHDAAFAYGIGGTTFVAATLIIMIAYTKVFLAVRRQMRSKTSVSRQRTRQGLSCQDQDQDQNKNRTIFVLEAPRDQDYGLEDCISVTVYDRSPTSKCSWLFAHR